MEPKMTIDLDELNLAQLATLAGCLYRLPFRSYPNNGIKLVIFSMVALAGKSATSDELFLSSGLRNWMIVSLEKEYLQENI